MSGVADAITGRASRKQAALAEQAQAEMAANLASQKARVDAIQKGQERAAQTGGGGMLAYVDDKSKLKATLG